MPRAANFEAVARLFRDYADQPRWVEWKEIDGNKVPYQPGKSREASINKPATWGRLSECRTERRGLVFNGDALGGLDLDACRNPETGELTQWATELIADFNSYAEVSPSGTGVKIFARGAPDALANNVLTMPGEPINGKQPQVEAYVSGRYFTVTGERLPEAPDEIRAAPEAWARLKRRLNEQPTSERGPAGRNAALFKLACQLLRQGKSEDEVAAAVRAENRKGNVELHPNFAEGALPEREVLATLRSALKQQPQGESEDELLAKMNAEYCVVQDGGKTRVLRFELYEQIKDRRVVHRRLSPTYFAFGDFHNFHKNEQVWIGKKPVPLGNWWTSHPQRRSYRGLTFRPDKPEEVVDGRLNLWRGWGVEPKPGDWSLMRRHIREVIAAGDDEADTYIINWLAWAVQHPAEQAEVALVLKGGKGTGKGTLGNALCRIFGQHATHISSVRHLVGHFNAHLRDACFLFADEAYWPGDKAAEGTLKRLITEGTLQIEPKFVDAMTVPNMLHVLMASNEDWVVPAGEHERRYAVFEISEDKRQDRSWFEPLHDQMENGGYAAMLYDLLRRELGDWHPRSIPMTEALRRQQERSLKPLEAWMLKFFEDGILPTWENADRPNRALSRSQADIVAPNPRNGLYDLAREQPALRHVDEQVLAAELKKWGCQPWRNRWIRGWEFPPLTECRARWENKFPGWQWQHPDLTEWQSGGEDEKSNTGPPF